MLKKLLPIFILAVLVFIFFLRLFYPTLSIFMIPDFGESDVLHLNLPFKYILSTSLKNRQWPLWTPYLAGGFPILAEGQIGTFYLPNLIFFRFLPFIEAYNLNLVVAYLLAALGTYLFARKLGISIIASFFAAFIFTFSGFLAVHLNHFNLIQAASLLPFLFYCTLLIWQKPSFRYCLLFAFFLSQQIFTGHFYIVFITLISIFVYLIALLTLSGSWNLEGVKKILVIFFAVLSAFFMSAIQLIPTFELWQMSVRQGGLDFNTVTDYPYPFKHLITFIFPYFFGSPVMGTYPAFSTDWGIFWENTAYVGILPIAFLVVSFFFLKNKIIRVFLLMLFASLFLVLGKNSPFYFIFSFPLFNMFRVPSKFLLLTTFSLSILSGYSLEGIIKWIQQKLSPQTPRISTVVVFCGVLVLLFFIIFDEFKFSYNYPPATPAQWWTDAPPITKIIPENSKIISLGAPYLWNKVFKKEGWRDFAPYLYFKNSLYPNYNVFSSLRQADINTGGLIPRRLALFASNIKNIQIDEDKEDKKEASVNSILANTLNLAGVKYVISPYKMTHQFFTLKNDLLPPAGINLEPFHLYENKYARPRTYLVSTTRKIDTLEDFTNRLSDEDFPKTQTVLVENDEIVFENSAQTIIPLTIVSEEPTEIILSGNSDEPSLLVLTDTNYPGWKAYIDGIPAPIYNVNLIQRAIYFPPGKHQVKFTFQSDSFELGKKITIVSYFIISTVVFLSVSIFARKAPQIQKLSQHLYNTNDNLEKKADN